MGMTIGAIVFMFKVGFCDQKNAQIVSCIVSLNIKQQKDYFTALISQGFYVSLIYGEY